MMNGTDGSLLRIFVAAAGGAPMQELEEAEAIVGVGLQGDRYANGTGTFSKVMRMIRKSRHVTLIAEEALWAANTASSAPFSAAETRRNLLVKGLDLNGLVGRTFWVGEVQLRGTELCTPCRRPSDLAGKPGFKEVFEGRGGLRAEVLVGGTIYAGDHIWVVDEL